MNKEKMTAAITKKIGKEVEIKNTEQNEKDIIVTVDAHGEGYKVVLLEKKNQYGVYYRVEHFEPIDVAEKDHKDGIDEDMAVANLQAAQKFSEKKAGPVYVMSNGKRTTVIKTYANKVRHEKYGYWTAALFENGIQVSA